MATGGVSPDNSLVLGSEDVDGLQCQPCYLDGKTADVVGMCLTCQEYLCQSCFDGHKLPKPCRNHELLKKDQMLKKHVSLARTDKCSELCEHHTDEVIKYHCVEHDSLSCTDCIIMDHRMCKDVVYIPHVVQDLDNNKFYQKGENDLHETKKRLQNTHSLSSEKIKTLEKESACALELIKTFRKEINQSLNRIENKLEQQVASDELEWMMENLKSIRDECKQDKNSVEKMIKKFKDLKSSRQNCQVYIHMVSTRRKLNSLIDRLETNEDSVNNSNLHINFYPKTTTLDILKKSDGFGEVALEPYVGTRSPNDWKDMSQITVKKDEDRYRPVITGMVLLPDERLIIADYINEKLKIVDVDKGELTKEYGMRSPRDIILIKDKQIAVSVPDNEEVAFISIKGSTMSFDRYLMVNGECGSIDYRDGKLAVAYKTRDYVKVLNLQGDCLYKIQLGKVPKTFFGPCIAFSMDGTSLYVSNHRDKHAIRQYSMTGKVLSTYRNEELQHVNKVMIDSKGNVFFCDPNRGEVFKLSSDLKQAKMVALDIQLVLRPWVESLCYNESKGDFCIGGTEDKVQVLEKIDPDANRFS